MARSRTDASPSSRRSASSGTHSMSLTEPAACVARGRPWHRPSEWSQLPNALSASTYPAMLTGASVAWSPTNHLRSTGPVNSSTP